jgi:hypothetical protein
MPSPGDKVYKVSSIMLDEDGKRARVLVAVGVVPSVGNVAFSTAGALIDLSGAAFDALRAEAESKLAALALPALAGATKL